MYKKNLRSIKKINSLFNRLNIKKGENIVFHSNIAGLHQFEKKQKKKMYYEEFLKFLINYIGKNGTLLIPTYNYDFTKGKKFHRRTTKSQVGTFSNIILKKYYKSRTFDPIFSHLVFGKLKKEIFDCKSDEVFGNNSVFEIMNRKNFKIISFCCSPSTITFLHFIEKKLKVNYRYDKFFKGFCERKRVKIKYFVGKKKINYFIKEKKVLSLVNNRQFKKVSFGRFSTFVVKANYLFKVLKKKIDKNQNYLIKN